MESSTADWRHKRGTSCRHCHVVESDGFIQNWDVDLHLFRNASFSKPDLEGSALPSPSVPAGRPSLPVIQQADAALPHAHLHLVASKAHHLETIAAVKGPD